MEEQFNLLINSYVDNNVGIADHFLSKNLSDNLQQNIYDLQQQGKMKYAGIGNEKIADTNQQIRGDKIYWLD